MKCLDIERFHAAQTGNDPFPYVMVREFVRPEALGAVLADLPAMQKGGSFPIGAVRLGQTAQALVDELRGVDFRDAVAGKFGLDLDDSPTMMTLRGHSREKDGRIHTDSLAKRVTILLYLNVETSAWAAHQGCLRLLRGPDSLDDFVVEVPPVNGTLLVFPNGPTAWHGHKQFVGPRHVVQMNYMTNDNAARGEMRRHRISAFFKRFS
jgi:SM-20-related protein